MPAQCWAGGDRREQAHTVASTTKLASRSGRQSRNITCGLGVGGEAVLGCGFSQAGHSTLPQGMWEGPGGVPQMGTVGG